MKRGYLILVLSATFLLSACSGGSKTSLHVVARGTGDTVVDLETSGGSVGDQVIFSNELYDAENQEKISTDFGICVSVVPPLVFECIVTTELPDGQLTTVGKQNGARTTNVAAIVGGTGVYSGARGQVTISARGGDTFDLNFEIYR